uniref:Uncharacterized protein n=1 Tax=Fagus sylvatica TaxID=28930 RepID=A0A2N9F4T2_FAGSY
MRSLTRSIWHRHAHRQPESHTAAPRLSHCRTTFSNPTPPEYHCPTLISGDPIFSSGFTSWNIDPVN